MDPFLWDVPRVITTKADERKRVVLPQAKPGHVYTVEVTPEGYIMLRELKPSEAAQDRPVNVRFEKRGPYTVGVTDRGPISEAALKEALADFPP
jgi:hypothetical protein